MYHEPAVKLSKKLCVLTDMKTCNVWIMGLMRMTIDLRELIRDALTLLVLQNAYHGSTFGSLSMSAISLNMRKTLWDHY